MLKNSIWVEIRTQGLQTELSRSKLSYVITSKHLSFQTCKIVCNRVHVCLPFFPLILLFGVEECTCWILSAGSNREQSVVEIIDQTKAMTSLMSHAVNFCIDPACDVLVKFWIQYNVQKQSSCNKRTVSVVLLWPSFYTESTVTSLSHLRVVFWTVE